MKKALLLVAAIVSVFALASCSKKTGTGGVMELSLLQFGNQIMDLISSFSRLEWLIPSSIRM